MTKYLGLCVFLTNICYAANTFEVCKQSTIDWAKISQPETHNCLKITYDENRAKAVLQDKTEIVIDPEIVMVYVPGNSISFYDKADFYWAPRIISFLKHYAETWRFSNCVRKGAYGHMTFCKLALLGDETVRLEQHKHELPFLRVMENKKYDIADAIYYFTKPRKLQDKMNPWVLSWPDDLKVNDMTKKGVKYDK